MPVPADAEAGLRCHRCHRCGYDLRAHGRAAVCPECGVPVAESRRMAALARRPSWATTDPRWRRRLVAGLWLLALLPLASLSQYGGWGNVVRAPTLIRYQGAVWSLADTLLTSRFPGVCQPVLVCTGIVLMFSAERGRSAARVGWPRRLGILCVWSTFVIAAADILFIVSLVSAGIGALFLGMPVKEQPRTTTWFVDFAWAYLHYGPVPTTIAYTVQVALSAAAILLACVPLYDALRRLGPRRWTAAALLAPLGLFGVAQLGQAVMHAVNPDWWPEVLQAELYFRPDVIARDFYPDPYGLQVAPTPRELNTEFLKWGVLAGLALWFSIAQVATWARRRREPGDR